MRFGMFLAPGALADRGRDGEALPPVSNPRQHLDLARQRRQLPVFPYRDSILYALEQTPVLVLVGETGSGKSTCEWVWVCSRSL